MSGAGHVVHLVRRFAGSLSRRPPDADDERWAMSFMTEGEASLWRRMPNVDRRHALEVARRFVVNRPEASDDEVAAACLHDVGKIESRLGTSGRVIATVVGPRTARFRLYHDHEEIGARWLEALGSSAATVSLIRRTGPAAAALEAADDV
jgi:predicted HD phosphohydrolase